MSITSPFTIRANSVLVFKRPESMFSYTSSLENTQSKDNISVIHLACSSCDSDHSSAGLCVVKKVVSLIGQRSRTGCVNIGAWLKYRKNNKVFNSILREIQDCHSFRDLDSVLSHYTLETSRQIEIVTELEKRKYVIFAVSNFQVIPRDEQPIVAGMLQRLAKDSPAYFSILSVGEPVLFRKTNFGEIGIQRHHDYTELQED